jgi:ankyrin repeat protein
MSAAQRSKFLRAAHANDIHTAAKLLQQAAVPVDAVSADGDTALTTAIKAAHVSSAAAVGSMAQMQTSQHCNFAQLRA